MPFAVFNRLNEERLEAGEALFANPRNAAAGTLKLQNSSIVAKRQLDCYLYYVPGEITLTPTHYGNLMKAREWGFNVPPYIGLCHNIDEILDFIHKWDVERKNLPVPIDGIVIKVNSIKQRCSWGTRRNRLVGPWPISSRRSGWRPDCLAWITKWDVPVRLPRWLTWNPFISRGLP